MCGPLTPAARFSVMGTGTMTHDQSETVDELSLRAHRICIGALGLTLPVLVWLVNGLRPTPPLERWRPLSAISEYYYTGASGLFAGVLMALALFLLTYRAYKQTRVDAIVGSIGGCGALVVALFPCTPPNCALELPWWSPGIGNLHYAGATVMFSSFMVFSIWLFTKSAAPEWRQRPLSKRRRDVFSIACGVVIGVSMIVAWCMRHGSIFWPETSAIIAFALSWLVKAWGSAQPS